jgi:hypothetical protein
MGWVVNATPRPLYPREMSPLLFVQESVWVLGPVWAGAENLAHTGVSTQPIHKSSKEFGEIR